MRAFSFVLLTAFLLPLSGKSCDCFGADNFCDAISHEGVIYSSLLIVHGKVIKKTPDFLKIEVINIPHGDYSSNTIYIHKNNSYFGQYYSESISSFHKGSTYLWALGQSEVGQYQLLVCSVSSLRVEGNDLIGSVTPGIDRLPLSEFSTLSDCSLDLTFPSIDVYPTLSHGEVKIEFGNDRNHVEIEAFNALGQKIFSESMAAVKEETHLVSTLHWPAGCYLIVCSTGNYRKATKIVII